MESDWHECYRASPGYLYHVKKSRSEGQWKLRVQDKDVRVAPLVAEGSRSVVVGGTNFWRGDIRHEFHLCEDKNNQLKNEDLIDNGKEERTGHFYMYMVVQGLRDESRRV